MLLATTHTIKINSTAVRAPGKRGFLVNGKINGVDFRGVVDFAADHGNGKIIDLVTDFCAVPGRFGNLEHDIIDAASVHAGVTL